MGARPASWPGALLAILVLAGPALPAHADASGHAVFLSSQEAQPPPEPPPDPLGLMSGQFDVKAAQLHFGGLHANLTEHFREALLYLGTSERGVDRELADRFTRNLFFYFSSPFYDVPDEQLAGLVQWNVVVSEVVSLSSYGTTDGPVAALAANIFANWRKILVLLNPRTTVDVSRDTLLSIAPEHFARWYTCYLNSATLASMEERAWENMKEHQSWLGANFDRVLFRNIVPSIYFLSSYVNHHTDRFVKAKFNEVVQRQVVRPSNLPIANTPNPRKIAVATANWHALHPIYDCLFQHIRALRPEYELTLVVFGGAAALEKADRQLFERVVEVTYRTGWVDISSVMANDFALVYFPDVGMSYESILLANMRLAPVQVMGEGHPISTFGSEVDYYVGGRDIEPPDGQENYSERLVLLPSLATAYSRPLYSPPARPKRTDAFIMNCPWTYQKINHALLRKIARIREGAEAAGRRVIFRFYPGLRPGNELTIFERNVRAVLGGSAEVLPFLRYGAYFETLAEAHLYLDSLPFGGQTTLATSLHLLVPPLTQEGDVGYGRWGAGQLRRLGLPELVAYSDDEFVRIAVRCVAEPAFLASVNAKLRAADLDATVFDGEKQGPVFKRTVDFLIANHARLREEEEAERRAGRPRAPIRVPGDPSLPITST